LEARALDEGAAAVLALPRHVLEGERALEGRRARLPGLRDLGVVRLEVSDARDARPRLAEAHEELAPVEHGEDEHEREPVEGHEGPGREALVYEELPAHVDEEREAELPAHAVEEPDRRARRRRLRLGVAVREGELLEAVRLRALEAVRLDGAD